MSKGKKRRFAGSLASVVCLTMAAAGTVSADGTVKNIKVF